MLLCNAIVGNYDESNFNTIPEKLLMERRMIMSGSSDSNSVYILFRVIPPDNDIIPKENQGLIISYHELNKSQENKIDDNSKRSHYLVPIYNEYNIFCYWISSRYLKLKKKEFCFTISDFIKEYWKQPILTQEFTSDDFMNNNILCFGNPSKDYKDYNRIINIEKEGNVQMICINLKYRNRNFIIIENLIESTKALMTRNSAFCGNDTIKDFYISEEQDFKKEYEKEVEQEQVQLQEQEQEKELDSELERGQDLYQEQVQEQNQEQEQEQELELELEQKQNLDKKNDIELNSTSGNCCEKDVTKIHLSDCEENKKEINSNKESNYELLLTSTQTNTDENLKLLTVCTEANVNIIQNNRINSQSSNSLAINKDEVVINQVFEHEQVKNTTLSKIEHQITNSSSTLEVLVTPVTTPIIRNLNHKMKNQENLEFQEIHPNTDLIQRNYSNLQTNNNFSSTNYFNTCKTRNQNNSFLPPGMQIDTGIGNTNQMNKEELILNRIESAKKNVNLNHRIHSGGNFYTGQIQSSRSIIPGNVGGICNYNLCANNHLVGTIINNHSKINGNYNPSFENSYNIDILSKKFNRALGKADYLLEQLSHSNDSNIKSLRSKNELDLFNGNHIIRKNKSSNSSYNQLNNFQNHILNSQQSTNSQIVLDNTFNSNNEILQQKPQILCNINKSTLKNFNYTRESNLSIVNNNVEIEKVLVDVQISTNNDIEQNLESIEISQTKLNQKEDLEKEVNNEEKILETVDFDENLNVPELESCEEIQVEEVEIRRRSVIDPELVEIDFYVNGGKLKSSFSILNILLSRWSGIPTVSKL